MNFYIAYMIIFIVGCTSVGLGVDLDMAAVKGVGYGLITASLTASYFKYLD